MGRLLTVFLCLVTTSVSEAFEEYGQMIAYSLATYS
jgi:hypothetical protein